MKAHLFFGIVLLILPACGRAGGRADLAARTVSTPTPPPLLTPTAPVTAGAPAREATATLMPPASAPPYYWPGQLPASLQLDPDRSSANATGFRFVTTVAQGHDLTLAGGEHAAAEWGARFLADTPVRPIQVRGAAGELYEELYGTILVWTEQGWPYFLSGSYAAEELLAFASALEPLTLADWQARLGLAVTPTVTPGGPLGYLWPSPLPEGLTLDRNASGADQGGFELAFQDATLGAWVRIVGGTHAEVFPSPSDDGASSSSARGQPALLHRGTGAGMALCWREAGHPLCVAGTLSEAGLQQFAATLESLSLAEWQQRLVANEQGALR